MGVRIPLFILARSPCLSLPPPMATLVGGIPSYLSSSRYCTLAALPACPIQDLRRLCSVADCEAFGVHALACLRYLASLWRLRLGRRATLITLVTQGSVPRWCAHGSLNWELGHTPLLVPALRNSQNNSACSSRQKLNDSGSLRGV